MSEVDVIVVGGGVGGLLAARALADAGQRVLVLDRDLPPETPGVRRGVPQGTQVHALLDAGRLAIEGLLPGLFEELLADGGAVTDYGAMRWYHAGHFKVRCETPYRMHVQTRPLLEHHVRRRVLGSEGVTVRHGVGVQGLELAQGRVLGVRLAGGELLRAPRVVCATGRGPQAIRWLEAAGLPTPPCRVIPLGVGYVTRFFNVPASWPADRDVLLLYGSRPHSTRHGLAFRVEGDRLQITLMGYAGDHPPTDLQGFRAWAASLERPELGELLQQVEPLGPAQRFTCPVQRRYDLHRVRLPEGLAVLGDAACALDPVFGQGMTVAALQAEVLGRLVAQGRFSTRAFQRAAARITDKAWLITSLEAQRYPEGAAAPDGLPLVGLLHRYLDRVYAASAYDAEVHRAFLAVMNLHAPATHLFRPAVLWRTLWPTLAVSGPAPAAALPAPR
ncbi:MAG: FAD-dependent monooxygenase [Alphaproteobacteria bacterium]|nr:FAD-dependent monooxygenase [Alphaproteobacteria bacterium]MCB9794332.1 FAD-dependent monooxygenase [Alphaproteobacteria bacterium]